MSMSTVSEAALELPELPSAPDSSPELEAKLEQSPGGRRRGLVPFLALLVLGLGYAGTALASDLSTVGPISLAALVSLSLALVVALGFEFVNGFHDTANAVATVIYTNSLSPRVAVVWSGICNFLGVLTSSGAVAFGIISLLPVELILKVGTGTGFAMVFALLTAAILWNLGTWYVGLPASSSHTLIGSILGVGIANQLMHGQSGAHGVDWEKASTIGKSLLISPLVGFSVAALLLLTSRVFFKNAALYKAPEGDAPPPFWVRLLLLLTCTGVSYAHGSNDGQKGMGLIMLILIGTAPAAYALNRGLPYEQTQDFVAVSHVSIATVNGHVQGAPLAEEAGREALTQYVRSRTFDGTTVPALSSVMTAIAADVHEYGSLSSVPAAQVNALRGDMYLVSESLRLLDKSKAAAFSAEEHATLANYKKHLDGSTRFIPTWVKVAVALALGLGTMVGWKRIVVTVGEKIGKNHLTYAQGASAELTAMATIGAADALGLPVSTTHVLSSGIAGTMAANKSGLQSSTVRNLLLAWVLTLPASVLLSGSLYWLFNHFV